jgi:peptidoglycan/xylan/chitin deacetylase (PgdA/CDA1 family)
LTQNHVLGELERVLQVEVDRKALNKSLYLSPDEVAEMVAQGMELGAHTMSHPSLALIDIETARQEIFQSGDWIKALSGQEKIAFAHPFGEGADSAEIISLLQEYGFYAACTVEEGLNTGDTNILNLKRVGMLDYMVAQ